MISGVGALLSQQGELARLNVLGGNQPIEIYPAGKEAAPVVATVPVLAVDARLLWPLVQHRHPLPGQGEHFHPRRSRPQQKKGDDGPAVEGVWGVLPQVGAVGQADPFPGQRQQLAAGLRIYEVVGQEEKVGEVDAAAAVEVEGGGRCRRKRRRRGRSRKNRSRRRRRSRRRSWPWR